MLSLHLSEICLKIVGSYVCEKAESQTHGKSFNFVVILRFIRIFRFRLKSLKYFLYLNSYFQVCETFAPIL